MPLESQRPGSCAPLWKRLLVSQRPISAPPSERRPLSFSCVVVPPPVPAAQARFDAHIASLVHHVQPLTFMTVTSRTPYLSADPDHLSPTQDAIAKIVRAVDADSVNHGAAVVLTIAGTMPASPEEKGLSREGLHRLLTDYLGRATAADTTSTATELSWVTPERAGLLTMRGADGGFTRQQWQTTRSLASTTKATTAPAKASPYGAFGDGPSLLHAALDVATTFSPTDSAEETPVTMLVPGFPEGHMLHRCWTCTEAEATTETPLARDALIERSYGFLSMLDEVLRTTAVPFHSAQAGQVSGADVAEAVRKLMRRTVVALQLGTVPAYLAPAALEAEVRELVTEKLIPMTLGADKTDTRAHRVPVVVTQTILDPQVFLAYAELVRRHFREAWTRLSPNTAAAGEATIDVVVLPGVLSPQRGEDFTRTALQLCVRTATPGMQALLQTYKDDLADALTAWEAATTAADANNAEALAKAAEAIHLQKEQAEGRFQSGMETFTLDVCRQLIEGGYSHFYFSAFAYGCGEALGHVVEQLQAESQLTAPTSRKHHL